MMFQHFLLKSWVMFMLAFRNSTEMQDLVFSWKPKPWTGTNGSLVVRVGACPLVPTANGSQRLEESRDVRYDKPENNDSLLVILAENPPGFWFSRAVSFRTWDPGTQSIDSYCGFLMVYLGPGCVLMFHHWNKNCRTSEPSKIMRLWLVTSPLIGIPALPL